MASALGAALVNITTGLGTQESYRGTGTQEPGPKNRDTGTGTQEPGLGVLFLNLILNFLCQE